MKLRMVLIAILMISCAPLLTVNAKVHLDVDIHENEAASVRDQSSDNDNYQDRINLSKVENSVSKSRSINPNIYAYNNDNRDEDDYGDNDNTYFDERFQKYAHNTPEYRETNGRSLFIFDPNAHRWMAYNSSGELVGSGRASGGKGYCPDIRRGCKTPTGNFRVYSIGGPGCVSSKYPIGKGGAPMPYCMFFHGGFAIHGSYDVPNRNASHGCIRVEPSAARWLQENVIGIGTTVIVRPY